MQYVFLGRDASAMTADSDLCALNAILNRYVKYPETEKIAAKYVPRRAHPRYPCNNDH